MYSIMIDSRNTPDIIEKITRYFESNPLLRMKLVDIFEIPIVDTITGEEVYKCIELKMKTKTPAFIVRTVLKHLGFTQYIHDKNVFMK